MSNFFPEQSRPENSIHVPHNKMSYGDDEQHQIKYYRSSESMYGALKFSILYLRNALVMK